MSACAAVHPHLPTFVAGELPASLRAQVREHLHQCCRCRGEAGLLQRAQSALGELGNEAADPRHEAMFADLHQAIVAATVVANLRTKLHPLWFIGVGAGLGLLGWV